MTRKKAGTVQKTAARIKKSTSSTSSGLKQKKDQVRQPEKSLPGKKQKPGAKPSVTRGTQPREGLRKNTGKIMQSDLLRGTAQDNRRLSDKQAIHLASFPQLNPNPVIEVNSVGEVVFHNKAAMQILRELHLEEDITLFLPADMHTILKSLDQKKINRFSREVRIKDRTYEESIYTTPASDTVRIYANDVTARKQAEEALLSMNQRLSLLSDASARLLVSKKPQETVSKLCTKVMEHLDCHVFFNFLVDKKKKRLHLNAYAGIPAKAAKKIEWLDYGVAVCGTVARNGIRIVAENIPENPDPKTDLVRSYGIKAYVCHPLLSRQRVIGTLSFGSRTKTSFSEDEIGLMKTIAFQVSIAMERLQAHVRMEATIRERTAALSKALEALKKKIGELNLAKNILAEQSEQLESFFTHTITPLVFLDPDFNFIRVNEAYARTCSRDASEFPGQNHFEFYPDEENEAIFRKVVETKVPYQVAAKPFVFPDHPEWGVTYWDWVLFPVLDNENKVAFLVFSLQEVTDRTLAEQAIFASEKKYRSLIEQASDGIMILDRSLNFIDANPMASQISGFSREELLRMNAGDLVPDEDRNIIPHLVDKIFTGETVRQEMRVLGRDGKQATVEISANLLEDGNIQMIARDITARKETENRDHFITQLLELFAKKASRKDYLDSVVHLIHEWTGCRHVGIRVVNKERYIPYAAYRGFSEEFMKLESMISLDSDVCACIRIINGKYEPQDSSALTPSGSFCLANANKFIGQLTKPELARFRGNCMRSGYVFLSIIPVLYKNQPLGALHLADEREGLVPLHDIQFLESTAAPLIGEAICRFSAEESLLASKASLADAQRLARLGNWDWDIKTNTLHWSDEIYHIFGLSPQQFGATYDAFLGSIHPDDREQVKHAVQEALQKGKPYVIDHRIILPDGTIRIVQEQGEVQYDIKREPVRMAGTVQDITNQKRIEEELRDSREELRNLFLHLQSVREEERTHIAREIHDEFGTILTALKIDLSWLERQMPRENSPQAEKIKKDLDLINSAIKTVQRISSELRPGILDHLGLAAAMEWQVKEFCNRTGVSWDIAIDLGDANPDRDLSTSMFRILQESLTNIARHAEATEVSVRLSKKDKVLVLEIADDGKGVTEEQLSDRNSFGLIGMRERAQHLGGNVLIKSADGKGTRVLVTIPL